MRLISLLDVQNGMILGKSIYEPNYKLLLGAGFRLTPTIKVKLMEKGYNHIYIMEDGTDKIIPEDIISDEIKHQVKIQLTDKADAIERILKLNDISSDEAHNVLTEGYLKKVNLTRDMKNIVNEIFKDIASSGAVFMSSIMFKSKDTYLMDHALNTTVLSILIGKKYGFGRSELHDLALGAFLHDFGKIVIEKMKDSNSKTANELIKEHPTFGYLLVHNSRNASPVVSQIINQHHESQDGSGYPMGLKGENLPPTKKTKRKTGGYIYRLAEVVTVANAYDYLVMNPLKENQLTPAQAIRQLVVNSGKQYNKDIVNTFMKIIPLYPVGTYVRISQSDDASLIGFSGVVAKVDEKDLNKPVIIILKDKLKRRVAPRITDISKLKNTELELIL